MTVAKARVRAKVCGITSPEDAQLACRAGADAIGVIFHAKSPRNVTLAQAREIKSALPPFVVCVAVVRNATVELVSEIVSQLNPDFLQFHGDESGDFCRQFGRPYIKAVPMGAAVSVNAFAEEFNDASALLLDSHGGGAEAGKGKTFDWNAVPEHSSLPLILAGGLHAENVAAGIAAVKPYAVDVASGVESTPGRKDAARIQAFFKGIY